MQTNFNTHTNPQPPPTHGSAPRRLAHAASLLSPTAHTPHWVPKHHPFCTGVLPRKHHEERHHRVHVAGNFSKIHRAAGTCGGRPPRPPQPPPPAHGHGKCGSCPHHEHASRARHAHGGGGVWAKSLVRQFFSLCAPPKELLSPNPIWQEETSPCPRKHKGIF